MIEIEFNCKIKLQRPKRFYPKGLNPSGVLDIELSELKEDPIDYIYQNSAFLIIEVLEKAIREEPDINEVPELAKSND